MTGYGKGVEGAMTHVFDMLEAAPGGMTAPQMADVMGCSKSWVQAAIRELKLFCHSAGDTATVVCDPDPDNLRGPQIYKLVGNLEAARANLGVNLQHVESTLVTIHAQTQTLLRGTDKRTREGRRLVALDRGLTYIVGELADKRDEIAT